MKFQQIELLLEQIIFEDTINGSETVFPAYLFAFFEGTSVITDSYLVNTDTFNAGNFRRYFRFKSEPALFQI